MFGLLQLLRQATDENTRSGGFEGQLRVRERVPACGGSRGLGWLEEDLLGLALLVLAELQSFIFTDESLFPRLGLLERVLHFLQPLAQLVPLQILGHSTFFYLEDQVTVFLFKALKFLLEFIDFGSKRISLRLQSFEEASALPLPNQLLLEDSNLVFAVPELSLLGFVFLFHFSETLV